MGGADSVSDVVPARTRQRQMDIAYIQAFMVTINIIFRISRWRIYVLDHQYIENNRRGTRAASFSGGVIIIAVPDRSGTRSVRLVSSSVIWTGMTLGYV